MPLFFFIVSGVLLLSLLQSRLNWTSSVFPKYKADANQQPKRHSNTRKKWPNMTFLGVGTLELGAHTFDNTQFFQAKRTIPFLVKDQQEEDVVVEEFVDIVFELTEVPNERFVFPKEAMISLFVEDGPIVVSLLLETYTCKSAKSDIHRYMDPFCYR